MLQALIILTGEMLTLSFKNNAPFRSHTSNINSTFMDDAEDLDIAMPMYNLKHNESYSMTLRSL